MGNERLNLAQTTTIRTAIQSMINRTCIVSYGIVKEVLSDGIVTVELSVAHSAKDIKIITCILLNIASANFTVHIEPAVNDKVLVLYPDKFDTDMFNPSAEEAIINENATGYNLFSGIAILMNQYKKNSHKNFIDCKENGILTYSVDTNAVTIDLSDTENKNISITDSNGCSLTSSDGNISIVDANGCKIETSSESIKINGHLEIKK